MKELNYMINDIHMKILTVSVAAYNVENYLRETLDSFIHPELDNKVEILVVDDGSKDRTTEIAIEYQNKYPQIFRSIRKENGGHGSTINRGLEEASGKYFKIVDGDDWVDTDEFVRFINLLATCDEDLVLTNFCKVFPNKIEKVNHFSHISIDKKYSDIDFPDIKALSMHNVAVKTNILRDNKVKISEKCFYVDLEFKLYAINLSKSIRIFNLYVYQYRLGLSEQSVNIKNMKKNINMHEKVSLVCLDYFVTKVNTYNSPAKKKEFLRKSISKIIGDQLRLFLLFKPDQEIKSKLEEYDGKIKKANALIYKESAEEFKLMGFIRKTSYNSLYIPHLLLIAKIKLSNLLK